MHAFSQASELTRGCFIDQGTRRRGVSIVDQGHIALCSSQKEDLESSKTFKKKIGFLSEMVIRLSAMRNELAEVEARKTNRLFHNLTSINAHTIQELYALVPQERLAASFKMQKAVVREKLLKDPDAMAAAFLRVLKNEISLRNEFSAYLKLYDPNPALRIAAHPLHKVVLNVANLFFQDFADRFISVVIEPTDLRLKLDYDSFHVALYHLLDNAAKYTEPGTELQLKFALGESGVRIDMVMTSLYISPTETTRLFEDGFSGEQPKIASASGKGLGMGMARELLRLNDAILTIKAGRNSWPSAHRLATSDVRYSVNVFSISFASDAILGGQGLKSENFPTKFGHTRKR